MVGFFKSGAPLLPGFVIVDLPTPAPKRYGCSYRKGTLKPIASRFDSLEVPEGWKPDPNRVWGSTQGEESSNNLGVNSASSHHQWKAGMSADEVRAYIAIVVESDKFSMLNSEARSSGSNNCRVPNAQFGITFPRKTESVYKATGTARML